MPPSVQGKALHRPGFHPGSLYFAMSQLSCLCAHASGQPERSFAVATLLAQVNRAWSLGSEATRKTSPEAPTPNCAL